MTIAIIFLKAQLMDAQIGFNSEEQGIIGSDLHSSLQ
jgi:hypothetical protein